MHADKKVDPVLEWGHEAAIAVFIVAMVAAIAVVLSGALTDGSADSRAVPATIILAVGAATSYAILRLRKSRERASRPGWMGTTTAWQASVGAKNVPPEKEPPVS